MWLNATARGKTGCSHRARGLIPFAAGITLAFLVLLVPLAAVSWNGLPTVPVIHSSPTVARAAATLPGGFQESIALSGLTEPTAVRFASDGRVFVAEKSGIIKVFDNLTDTSPTIFADLRTNTHNFWDRGLLGLALDPNFPVQPWVYALYTHDAVIGGTAPRWGKPRGGTMAPPTAEGGALRSQDLQTISDPATLDGAILRVDPATGAAAAGNPGTGDTNAQRIVAYGLRNPFRFTIRPGTNELWIGDVGWDTWEEIDRFVSPTDVPIENFGWPCYEGNDRQAGYDSANLNICENLYVAGSAAVAAPYYTYNHSATILPGETCPAGSSSITGLAFYGGGSYPAEYNGALFFGDYSRNCIWVMFPGANGLPDPNNRMTFVAPGAGPVDLQIGPGGDLFYVDYNGGTIRRVTFGGPTPPPPPPDAIPVNAFRGGYFDNADLTNLIFNRTDPNIDFDWGLGSPDPRIEPDTFSVRWTGNWDFGIAGTYRFTMTADDGMRYVP